MAVDDIIKERVQVIQHINHLKGNIHFSIYNMHCTWSHFQKPLLSKLHIMKTLPIPIILIHNWYYTWNIV